LEIKRLRLEIGIILRNPGEDISAKPFGKPVHFVGFNIRNRIRPLVVRDVSLLSKNIELSNDHTVHSDRQFERLDYSVVMIGSFSLIAGRRQSGCTKLQGCIIGDVESPIAYKAGGLGGFEITICDDEEVGDFVAACFVRPYPPVLEPVV
jgi:hypothetical protein